MQQESNSTALPAVYRCMNIANNMQHLHSSDEEIGRNQRDVIQEELEREKDDNNKRRERALVVLSSYELGLTSSISDFGDFYKRKT